METIASRTRTGAACIEISEVPHARLVIRKGHQWDAR